MPVINDTDVRWPLLRPFSGPVPAAMGALAGLLLSIPIAHSAESAANQLHWHTGVDVRYDDNVGLAPDNDSKRDTFTTHVTAGVTWQPLETATRSFSVSVDPFYEFVTDLEDLSNFGAAVGLNLRQQFNENFTAPFVDLSATATWLEHQDSEIRDGYKIELSAALGKQFGPRFGGRVGVKYHYRQSTKSNPEGTLLGRNSNDVFDLESGGPFARVEVNPLPKSTLFFEYQRREGDVAATGSPNGFNSPASFDSARDFAFEEGTRFVSWRIDADQNIFGIGLDHDVNEHLGIQVTANYLDAKGDLNNDYENYVVTLGATWDF